MDEKKLISRYYQNLTGSKAREIVALPGSGSDRKYYRVLDMQSSIIAVINSDRQENDTFIAFTNHFRSKQLAVPEILEYFPDKMLYFQSDLGDSNLFTWIENKRQTEGFGNEAMAMYKGILESLVSFQTKAIQGLDLSLCYPHQYFDEQSMIWDMNYFKYMFLKLLPVPFDEKRLEKDFFKLRSMLKDAGNDFFLYRDFQSANIMILDNKPWFIDYQGGRGGAPQYDPASLLYDSKALIPQNARDLLLEHYIGKLTEISDYDESIFRELYPAFALIRIMQALGAYGYRGLFEQKPGFAQSIVPAVKDVVYLIDSNRLEKVFPELSTIMIAAELCPKYKSLLEDFEEEA